MKNNIPVNPTDLFNEWFHMAEGAEDTYPGAMALASVDTEGKPAVRIVLMRGFNEKGLHFFTNYESNKGKALIANPYAEANFYWKSLERQIRVFGVVEKTTPEESDTYFNNRPRDSRIGAWASQQSREMEDYTTLEKAIGRYDEEFEGIENPSRPDYWGGFRIIPQRVEFWHEQPYRLHKRFIYTKDESGAWSVSWLYP